MKKTMLAALCTALAACGGDKDDPADRTFTYGASAPVAPASPEQYAADDGSGLLADGATYQSSGDPAAAEAASGSLPMLPDDMASNLFAGAGVAFAPMDAGAKRVASAMAPGVFTGQALGEGFDDPACMSATPGEVRYTRCTITDPDGTMTVGVDGTFTRTADVFSWDATVVVTMTDVDFSMRGTNRLYGSFTFGPSTIAGRARSDVSASATIQGQSMSAGTTTIADVDLVYARDPFCVTGGTLELRRVWTQRPPDMPRTGEYADQGVKFTWEGCGLVMVARSQ